MASGLFSRCVYVQGFLVMSPEHSPVSRPRRFGTLFDHTVEKQREGDERSSVTLFV